jgi:diguanylate cyclase (GGDEF)-like protein
MARNNESKGRAADDDAHVGKSGQAFAEPLTPERKRRAVHANRSYYHWVRMRRVAFACFLALAVASLLWLIPWLPSGLNTVEYTPQVEFTVYLLGGVTIFAVLALVFQEFAHRQRAALTLWASVYDEATGLHNRTYLHDRLAVECDRARRTGKTFSLIAFQLRIGDTGSASRPKLSNDTLRRLAEVINSLSRPSDFVALLTGSELAVFADGIDRDERHVVQERLRGCILAELPHLLDANTNVDVKGGVATYGVDGTEAAALVQAARTSGVLGVHKRSQAA